MNQIKIGKFIAECRKKNNLTQMQLAEKLNITDRAISKWETGKAMPDSSIMLDLCNELKISVNELLSGEMIEMNNYDKRAEENLLKLNKSNENKSKMLLHSKIVILLLVLIIIILAVIMPFHLKQICYKYSIHPEWSLGAWNAVQITATLYSIGICVLTLIIVFLNRLKNANKN